MRKPSLDDRAQAQWPGRWTYHMGYWSEDDWRDDTKMIVDSTGMDYLLSQVPRKNRKPVWLTGEGGGLQILSR
jgi:hypothetical protein